MMFLFLIAIVFFENSIAVTPPSLLSFPFARSQCLQDKFQDSTGYGYVGELRGVGSTAACTESDGASSLAKLKSTLNVALLKGQLGNSDFTLEIWLKPKSNLTSASTIVSFGKDTALSGCKSNLLVSISQATAQFFCTM